MRISIGLLAVLAVGCGNDLGSDDGDDVSPDAGMTPIGPTDPLEGLPTGRVQWQQMCAKGYGDMITAKFCAGANPPVFTSLKALQTFLGLDVRPNPNLVAGVNAHVSFTFTGLSTGLGLRTVTPLNPRAFLMTPALSTNAPNPNYQVLAFARGEPFVELVAKDPAANTLRFFLVRFHPSCESTGSCTPADMLTPAVESGWTDYTIYDDDTIKNTTLDCLNCHQPGGPGTRRMLRMQELANPFAHWFYIEHANNRATMDDFHLAHGVEDYAGIPANLVDPSRPGVMMRLLQNNGFGVQPNAFDSNRIEMEMTGSGTSSTWNALYAKSVVGLEIPPPYFGVPQTDPAKVAPMIAAYQQVMAGTLPPGQLPDIRDTLLDLALPDMSIRPQAGLDGTGILVQMCTRCHNSRLDQTISRAGFNVETLGQMSREKKDEAIMRLQLPDTDKRKMPPSRFHILSDPERDLVIEALSN